MTSSEKGFTNTQRAEVLTQAIPYIKRYAGKIIVIKYGGNAMINNELKEQVMRDTVLLWYLGVKVVLVHGGGPEINHMLERVGKESKFVDNLKSVVKDSEKQRLDWKMITEEQGLAAEDIKGTKFYYKKGYQNPDKFDTIDLII